MVWGPLRIPWSFAFKGCSGVVCMSHMFAFMSAVVPVQGYVGMFVVYRELLKVVGFISRCEVLCVMYLCRGCNVFVKSSCIYAREESGSKRAYVL